MNSDNYVVIQGWMCNELNLKGNDLLIFALIYGFSQDSESAFSGSRKYISNTFNISMPTVDKALQNLVDKGYIIKKMDVVYDYTKPYSYYVNQDVVKKLYMGSKETLQGGSKETLHNNTNNISISKDIDIINNTKDNKIEWFLAKYNEICVSFPKVKSITDKRKKAIKKILKSYSEEDILDVFEKAESSDFLKGNNDRGWKANIDFMLREDKFVNILEGQYGGRKKTKSVMRDIEGLNRVAGRARKGDDDDGTKF